MMNMMNIISIKKEQAWFYNASNNVEDRKYIEPGEYLTVFFPKDQKEEMKKLYPLIPATVEEGIQTRFYWLAPVESWILKSLYQQKFQYTLEDINFLKVLEFQEKIEKLDSVLLRWQKNFLKFCFETIKEGKSFRTGLIAGLGAGKTLVFLLVSLLARTVYVAPKHLHSTVIAECEKWEIKCPIITTPESCNKNFKKKNNNIFPIRVAIVDEALSCKNPDATRTGEVIETLKDFDVIVAGTATPLSVNPLDIRWLNVVDSILPSKEKNFIWQFGTEPYYKDLSKVGVVHSYVDYKGEIKTKNPLTADSYNLELLNEYIEDSLKTVDISDINAQIPKLRKEKVLLSRPSHYSAVKRGFVTARSKMKAIKQAMTCTSGFYYDDENEVVLLAQNHKLKWVKKFVKDNPYEPIVIFSAWSAEQKILEKELSEIATVAVNTAEKENIQDFVGGKAQILISSANRSEGMNLQRSHVAIYTSFPLSPMKLAQSYGRLYRQGQKKSVIFYHLMCRNTFDVKLFELLTEHMDKSEEFIQKALDRKINRFFDYEPKTEETEETEKTESEEIEKTEPEETEETEETEEIEETEKTKETEETETETEETKKIKEVKIKVSKKELIKALKCCKNIVSQKEIYPVLENVKILVEKDNGVLLQATDLKISLTYNIASENVEIIEEGVILLPVLKLFNLIKEIPESDIFITQENLDGIVICKDGKFTIRGEEPEKFPDIPKFEKKNCVSIDGEGFQKLIKKTIFATTNEKTRYDLDNVLINIDDEKVCFVATDGKRLVLSERKFQEKTLEIQESMLVPVAGLQQINRIIGVTAPKTVKISVFENQLLFQTEKVILSTRLSKGRFPLYKKVIPKNLPLKATVMKKDLLTSLKKLKPYINEKNKVVKLMFGRNSLKLYTLDESIGIANLEIPIKYEGEPFDTKFNPDFFTDVLKILDSNEIEMLVKDGKSAILIQEENFKYIVLPIKIEDNGDLVEELKIERKKDG